MNFQSINLNDTVKVKPTAKGIDVYEQQFKDLKLPIVYPPTDLHGYWSMALWEVMRVFGPYMFNGAELVIETTIFFISEPTRRSHK